MNPNLCKHQRKEVRRRKDSLNRDQFAMQCLDCGSRVSDFVSRSKIGDPAKVADWDAILQEQGEADATAAWQAKREQLDAEREERNAAWWTNYNLRLSLPDWKEKRLAVLERDDYLCRACLKNRATEVHHLSYKHLGAEPLFELTSVCGKCHTSITAIDRNPDYSAEIQRQLSALVATAGASGRKGVA